jgi:DNA (cytosine-5)-methyltransferase 1
MDQTPTHLDLFSGIGGFALAAQWAGFRTIGFCEIDKYCQKVLAKNFMADTDGWSIHSGIPQSDQRAMEETNVRTYGDIRGLDGRDFAGVSLITGGFPCQPFSVAGKRRGEADDRAIWSEMFRVINEARPAWVLGENVPGIIPMELDNVLSDLEGIGYATRPFNIGAVSVDARHRRQRIWIIGRNMANTGLVSERRTDGPSETEGVGSQSEFTGCGGVSNADQQGLEGRQKAGSNGEIGAQSFDQFTDRSHSESESSGGREVMRESESRLGGMADGVCRWLDEPNIPRVRHRIPDRVNRLKGLGNAIVPAVAYELLMEIRKLI